MVNFCAVFGCGNRANRDKKSFFRLPAILDKGCERTKELSRKRREKWLANISREIKQSNVPYIRVCSDHFVNKKPSSLFDHTNPDWVPTLKLGHNKISNCATEQDQKRHKRSVERQQKKRKLDAEFSMADIQNFQLVEGNEENEVSTDGTASQTDLSTYTISAMQSEIQRLLAENRALKEQINIEKSKFDRNYFQNDDEKVKYYTGLPDFSTLEIVCDYVDKYIPHNSANVLSKFQMVVLVLIKLRLNLSNIDIAQKFNISQSSVSRLFLNMIDILYFRLRPMIYWPDHEQLRESMPMAFRTHYGTSVSVIVDCFEVFLERPSNLTARTLTWSSYKHNNTVKYLIGIAPQGVISFISKGWGGRASDKFVMENCGILQQLNPGDIVLADRGFDIADSVAMMGAKLQIPSFTRGKRQLSGEEVENTRRIANVRIHVERVIGSLRQKYCILQNTVPIDYVMSSDENTTTLDKMTLVCCALTNLCPFVVPID